MRGCLGVVAGLIIGAAIAFAGLAVVATVGQPDSACTAQTPSGWLIRAEVPWAQIRREMMASSVSVAGGTATVQELGAGPCGSLLVRADWKGAGIELHRLGLVLNVDQGAGRLIPDRLLLGEVSLPLQWLPDAWLEDLAQPVTGAGGAALARGLQADGMQVCGLEGEEDGLAIYLCAEGE